MRAEQMELSSCGLCTRGPQLPSPSSGGALTIQLPDTHPVRVGEPVVQWVAHRALVVGLHDGARGRHVAQPNGMAELVHSHGEQVHAMGIWGHREE